MFCKQLLVPMSELAFSRRVLQCTKFFICFFSPSDNLKYVLMLSALLYCALLCVSTNYVAIACDSSS